MSPFGAKHMEQPEPETEAGNSVCVRIGHRPRLEGLADIGCWTGQGPGKVEVCADQSSVYGGRQLLVGCRL